MYLHHWRRFQAADFPPILLPIQGAQPARGSCTWDKASPLVNHKQYNNGVNISVKSDQALTRLCMAFLHWPSVLSSRSQDTFPRLGRSPQPGLPDSIISRNWSIYFITSFAIWKKALLASAYPECEMEVAPPGISNPFTPANTLNYILPIFSLNPLTLICLGQWWPPWSTPSSLHCRRWRWWRAPLGLLPPRAISHNCKLDERHKKWNQQMKRCLATPY